MITDEPDTGEFLRLQLNGRVGINDLGELLEQIRGSESGVEIDFSTVESLDLAVVQFIVAVVPDLRKHGRQAIITDSEEGVLRSVLELSGIRPERAGLSARLTL